MVFDVKKIGNIYEEYDTPLALYPHSKDQIPSLSIQKKQINEQKNSTKQIPVKTSNKKDNDSSSSTIPVNNNTTTTNRQDTFSKEDGKANSKKKQESAILNNDDNSEDKIPGVTFLGREPCGMILISRQLPQGFLLECWVNQKRYILAKVLDFGCISASVNSTFTLAACTVKRKNKTGTDQSETLPGFSKNHAIVSTYIYESFFIELKPYPQLIQRDGNIIHPVSNSVSAAIIFEEMEASKPVAFKRTGDFQILKFVCDINKKTHPIFGSISSQNDFKSSTTTGASNGGPSSSLVSINDPLAGSLAAQPNTNSNKKKFSFFGLFGGGSNPSSGSSPTSKKPEQVLMSTDQFVFFTQKRIAIHRVRMYRNPPEYMQYIIKHSLKTSAQGLDFGSSISMEDIPEYSFLVKKLKILTPKKRKILWYDYHIESNLIHIITEHSRSQKQVFVHFQSWGFVTQKATPQSPSLSSASFSQPSTTSSFNQNANAEKRSFSSFTFFGSSSKMDSLRDFDDAGLPPVIRRKSALFSLPLYFFSNVLGKRYRLNSYFPQNVDPFCDFSWVKLRNGNEVLCLQQFQRISPVEESFTKNSQEYSLGGQKIRTKTRKKSRIIINVTLFFLNMNSTNSQQQQQQNQQDSNERKGEESDSDESDENSSSSNSSSKKSSKEEPNKNRIFEQTRMFQIFLPRRAPKSRRKHNPSISNNNNITNNNISRKKTPNGENNAFFSAQSEEEEIVFGQEDYLDEDDEDSPTKGDPNSNNDDEETLSDAPHDRRVLFFSVDDLLIGYIPKIFIKIIDCGTHHQKPKSFLTLSALLQINPKQVILETPEKRSFIVGMQAPPKSKKESSNVKIIADIHGMNEKNIRLSNMSRNNSPASIVPAKKSPNTNNLSDEENDGIEDEDDEDDEDEEYNEDEIGDDDASDCSENRTSLIESARESQLSMSLQTSVIQKLNLSPLRKGIHAARPTRNSQPQIVTTPKTPQKPTNSIVAGSFNPRGSGMAGLREPESPDYPIAKFDSFFPNELMNDFDDESETSIPPTSRRILMNQKKSRSSYDLSTNANFPNSSADERPTSKRTSSIGILSDDDEDTWSMVSGEAMSPQEFMLSPNGKLMEDTDDNDEEETDQKNQGKTSRRRSVKSSADEAGVITNSSSPSSPGTNSPNDPVKKDQTRQIKKKKPKQFRVMQEFLPLDCFTCPACPCSCETVAPDAKCFTRTICHAGTQQYFLNLRTGNVFRCHLSMDVLSDYVREFDENGKFLPILFHWSVFHFLPPQALTPQANNSQNPNKGHQNNQANNNSQNDDTQNLLQKRVLQSFMSRDSMSCFGSNLLKEIIVARTYSTLINNNFEKQHVLHQQQLQQQQMQLQQQLQKKLLQKQASQAQSLSAANSASNSPNPTSNSPQPSIPISSAPPNANSITTQASNSGSSSPSHAAQPPNPVTTNAVPTNFPNPTPQQAVPLQIYTSATSPSSPSTQNRIADDPLLLSIVPKTTMEPLNGPTPAHNSIFLLNKQTPIWKTSRFPRYFKALESAPTGASSGTRTGNMGSDKSKKGTTIGGSFSSSSRQSSIESGEPNDLLKIMMETRDCKTRQDLIPKSISLAWKYLFYLSLKSALFDAQEVISKPHLIRAYAAEFVTIVTQEIKLLFSWIRQMFRLKQEEIQAKDISRETAEKLKFDAKMWYFEVLEQFYISLEELGVPPPCGFQYDFARTGFEVLPTQVFIQYVEREVFVIDTQFLDTVQYDPVFQEKNKRLKGKNRTTGQHAMIEQIFAQKKQSAWEYFMKNHDCLLIMCILLRKLMTKQAETMKEEEFSDKNSSNSSANSGNYNVETESMTTDDAERMLFIFEETEHEFSSFIKPILQNHAEKLNAEDEFSELFFSSFQSEEIDFLQFSSGFSKIPQNSKFGSILLANSYAKMQKAMARSQKKNGEDGQDIGDEKQALLENLLHFQDLSSNQSPNLLVSSEKNSLNSPFSPGKNQKSFDDEIENKILIPRNLRTPQKTANSLVSTPNAENSSSGNISFNLKRNSPTPLEKSNLSNPNLLSVINDSNQFSTPKSPYSKIDSNILEKSSFSPLTTFLLQLKKRMADQENDISSLLGPTYSNDVTKYHVHEIQMLENFMSTNDFAISKEAGSNKASPTPQLSSPNSSNNFNPR